MMTSAPSMLWWSVRVICGAKQNALRTKEDILNNYVGIRNVTGTVTGKLQPMAILAIGHARFLYIVQAKAKGNELIIFFSTIFIHIS